MEVAAFRIALEAFVNVQRHAKAHACTIRLTIDGPLHVDVIDDGIGFATDAHPGVGIHSMEVRAAELGGVCTVTCPEGGGTRVHALPPDPASGLWDRCGTACGRPADFPTARDSGPMTAGRREVHSR